LLLWALVALGGALGAMSRYAVDRSVSALIGPTVLGTFAANISGSFLLGFILAAASGRLGLSEEARIFLAVGFLGSYTTFSTLTVASVLLAGDGDWVGAALNILGSIVVGIVAAFAGVLVGRIVF